MWPGCCASSALASAWTCPRVPAGRLPCAGCRGTWGGAETGAGAGGVVGCQAEGCRAGGGGDSAVLLGTESAGTKASEGKRPLWAERRPPRPRIWAQGQPWAKPASTFLTS